MWVDLMIWGEMVHDATRMPDQCYKEGVIGKGGVWITPTNAQALQDLGTDDYWYKHALMRNRSG